jgi:serine/threonine protein kinase
VNIANSLRFINDYNIVHMDINLNNILVFRDYITKLIDFGEAYSLKLRSSSGTLMKRGYTPPFCSPEYFQRKDNFIIQQDIFSLGMIIYRMIFSEYPFFPSNSLVSTYKEKTYGKKMLLAPERGEAFGNGQTVDLIYKVFFKCISLD